MDEGPKKITDQMLVKVFTELVDRLVKTGNVYEMGLYQMLVETGRVAGAKADVVLEPAALGKLDAYAMTSRLINNVLTPMDAAVEVVHRYFPLERIIDGHAQLSFTPPISPFLEVFLELALKVD